MPWFRCTLKHPIRRLCCGFRVRIEWRPPLGPCLGSPQSGVGGPVGAWDGGLRIWPWGEELVPIRTSLSGAERSQQQHQMRSDPRAGSDRSALGCASQTEDQAEVKKGWKVLGWRGDRKGSWESLRRKARGHVPLRFPHGSLALGQPVLPTACLLSISHGHAYLQRAAPYVQGLE